MGYYYVCSVGRNAFDATGRNQGGELSPDLTVTMYSGAVAICPSRHEGPHDWRQTIATDEERVAREHGVLHVAAGQPSAPSPGSAWQSPYGYCRVMESAPAPSGGSFVLVRFEPATRPPVE